MLSAALVITFVLLSFAGCGGQSDGVTSVDIGYHSGKYDMIVNSVEKINCDYLLVYHSTASYAEIDACIDLLEQLSVSSKSTFQLCPDTLTISNANQKIILLGSTSYDESVKSASIIKNIRSNNYYDYMFRVYGNVLSINWVSKFGREDAFGYLIETLLPNGLESLFGTEYSHLYLSRRSDSPIVTIDDVNIIQYTVVVPGSPSLMEKYCAEQLVKKIKDATGTELPLVTDSAEESTYEILIGDTNRGETYVTSFFAKNRFAIAQYGSKLILRGGQIEATAAATALLTSYIENAGITAEPLHIKPGYCYTGNTERYSANNFNGYSLVYSDEFNSMSLDSSSWNVMSDAIPTYGISPGLMYYDADNVLFDGNNLVLRTQLGSFGYESGQVSSDNKISFKYGYVETRARFRTAPGYWVKLILTNQNYKEDTVSQIDVFNSLASNDTIFASAGVLESKTYYENYLSMMEPSYEAYRSVGLGEGNLLNDGQYHTYGVEWTEQYIRFYMDGVQYGIIEVTADKYKELNKELYMSFVIGVEMTDQLADDEAAQWPADVSIDWIRVYQKEGSSITRGEVVKPDAEAAN